MAAYLIVLRERVKDSAEMEIYGRKAQAAATDKMKPLAAYGKLQTLEGTPFEAIAVVEFPTFEDAEAWYNSAAYQEARQHRLKGAVCRIMIVQGV